MFHVGGSLTDLYDTDKHTITKQNGGGIADDIMKGANMLNNISIPMPFPKSLSPTIPIKKRFRPKKLQIRLLTMHGALKNHRFRFLRFSILYWYMLLKYFS